MKKKLLLVGACSLGLLIYFTLFNSQTPIDESRSLGLKSFSSEKISKKTTAEKMEAIEERFQFEYDMQKNPLTGLIPPEEKAKELNSALESRAQASEGFQDRRFSAPYTSRGPSNLGGRTRGFAIDISDPSGNTMLAGGVSSGLFRSANGGASWEKVSSNSEIHNVTAIAQDPRPGFQNIWYYGTGERLGNSAAANGAPYRGQGIWRSEDNGITWSQIPESSSTFELFDSPFDYIDSLAVSPITGDLFIAAWSRIIRYDGTDFIMELVSEGGAGKSDVKITSTGRVFACLDGDATSNGVFTSETGNGGYTRIAEDASPAGWSSVGRIVLGIAPSNPNIVYALFRNGNSGGIEADLWRYDLSTDTWTDFTSKLPDEPEGDLLGNDPFAIQGGYDLEVSVKPDDENFVVIGGTNVYRINNINTDIMFDRIGGYRDNLSYNLYDLGGGDIHHPDIHDLVFSPFDSDLLYSGTDGGIHSADITASSVGWTDLNNNYQTYQYYHVGMDPQAGSDLVIGGAQDNGTTLGGDNTFSNLNSATEMLTLWGGDGVAAAVGRTGAGINLDDIQFYYGAQLGVLRTLRNNVRLNILPTEASGDNNKSIFVTYFYLDTETNSLFYVNGNDVYKAQDASAVTAATWTDIGSLSTNENIRSIVSTRGPYTASSYTLFGGQNGGVFRLTNPMDPESNLTNAVDITPQGASTANFSVVTGMAIHPTNPDIAMVVYSNYGINNIFITANATSASPTWDLVERNLASFSIRSVAIAEVNGQTAYFVGTARGLYASEDPVATDWELEGPDEIGLAVVSSLFYRPSDNILLVGTHGNGMYQSSLLTLGIDDNVFKATDVTLYPNPATGPVKIAYNGTQTIKNVTVTDMNGKVILKQAGGPINSDIQLDTQHLSVGMYFVNLTIDTGDSIIKKLIIQ